VTLQTLDRSTFQPADLHARAQQGCALDLLAGRFEEDRDAATCRATLVLSHPIRGFQFASRGATLLVMRKAIHATAPYIRYGAALLPKQCHTMPSAVSRVSA
jgi:hypothetical protein